MTTLGDWTQRHILGQTYGDTSWRTLLGELRERHGSGRAVARATGVNESTIRRLLAGKTKTPKDATIQAFRRSLVAADARNPEAVTLHTRDRDSDRDRTLTNDNLKLSPGAMDRVVDAWIRTGDKEAAGAVFLDGITVPFYRAYLRPREGDVVAVDPDDVDEDGDYYYDDEGQPYDIDEGEDLPYYDDFDQDVADTFPIEEADRYGGDVA